MSKDPRFPSTEDMKRQFPLFRAMLLKDFRKNLYGDFPTMLIRYGIILFLFASFIAMGMRNEDISSEWTSNATSEGLVVLGIFMLFFPLHFIGGISAETLQGTFRNISLYPVGINTLTSSKLTYSLISTGSLLIIASFCLLTPFLIMGVLSVKLASFIFVIGALLFIAYFLVIFAGSFYANISAASGGVQNVGGYSFLAMCFSLFISYWPVRMVATAIFKLFDPNAKYVGEHQAHLTAHWLSHLSPYDLAFHFSRTYILGSPLDLWYLICIPVWILIGCLGIRHGSRVYMDVFFRRV